jgi:anti-anti-sigma factor
VSLLNDPSAFEVTTTFEEQNVVLSLHGRVENLAAFDLGASLDAAIDLHAESVLLDLTELDFMGAAGLVAVANAEKRFAEAGTELSVRTPSTLVKNLLDVMELSEMARLDRPRPGHDGLGRELINESTVPSRPFVSNSTDVRKLTGVPAEPEVVDGALRLVVELAVNSVKGADGVSVSLLRHGVLATVAASDQTIMEMDTDQYATGEGPCIDASLRGSWFYADSLDSETRWPLFTPQARALGIKSILSSPLKAFGEPVGALNIYSRTASTFDANAQEAASVFARKASVILSDARAGATDTQTGLRFQEALRSRETIAMAKGVVMERDRISEDDAFSILLRQSLVHKVPLLTQAEETVLAAKHLEIDPERGLDV